MHREQAFSVTAQGSLQGEAVIKLLTVSKYINQGRYPSAVT